MILAAYPASQAGDLNGDGIDDIIIGAHTATPNDAGQTYVIFGRNTSFPAIFELSSLNGTNGFTLNGIKAENWSSFSVSQAGDLNGDGKNDLAIGAYVTGLNGRKGAGQTYVVFGRNIPSSTISSSATSSLSTQFPSPTTTSNAPFVSPIDTKENALPIYVGIAAGIITLCLSIFSVRGYLYKKRTSSTKPLNTSLLKTLSPTPSSSEDISSEYGTFSFNEKKED